MPTQLVYSDYTPKYDVDLYHYTLSGRLSEIMRDGTVRAKSCHYGLAKSAIYFTTNPVSEPTIWKRQDYISPFVPIQLKLSSNALKYRRIDIIRWTEYISGDWFSSNMFNSVSDKRYLESHYRSLVERYAHSKGVDPHEEWYLCLNNVSLYNFASPLVWYKNEWASIDKLDAAIAEARHETHQPLLDDQAGGINYLFSCRV